MISKATYVGKFERGPAGELRVLVALVDDADVASAEWFASRATTLEAVEADVSQQVRARNDAETQQAALIDTVQKLADKEIPLAVKVVQPQVDPVAVWRAKAQQLVRIKAAQDAGVVFPAQDVTDLKTAVNAGVQAGYAGQF